AAHTEYLHTTTPLVSLDYPRVPPDLPSFPPRRSSDLRRALGDRRATHVARLSCAPVHEPHDPGARVEPVPHGPLHEPARREEQRSEEHTSELQSREKLVCRLLLEKKNKESVRKRRPSV